VTNDATGKCEVCRKPGSVHLCEIRDGVKTSRSFCLEHTPPERRGRRGQRGRIRFAGRTLLRHAWLVPAWAATAPLVAYKCDVPLRVSLVWCAALGVVFYLLAMLGACLASLPARRTDRGTPPPAPPAQRSGRG